MIVPIPVELVIAAILVGLFVLVVAVVEVIVWLRAAAATRLPARMLALILGGLVLGLTHSAIEWIDPSLISFGAVLPFAVVIGVLALTVVVARRTGPRPLLVGLLGAGLLYQFGWAGGRFVLPSMPILGDAMGQARCERDPYCFSADQGTTGTAELRINPPGDGTVARGTVRCFVDGRAMANKPLHLDGTLAVEGGGQITLDADLTSGIYDGAEGRPTFYMYLAGRMGGLDFISGEVIDVWTATDPSTPSEGTFSFKHMHMQRGQRPEPMFDDATGTLSWACPER